MTTYSEPLQSFITKFAPKHLDGINIELFDNVIKELGGDKVFVVKAKALQGIGDFDFLPDLKCGDSYC